jgi:sulfoxide reductase heme-binding subunit YedZ
VAVDLLGVVILTSLLRNRIGPRAFKAVHWLTYGIWPIAVLHAIGNGTDSFSLWFFGLAVTCSLAVAGALCWRLYSNFVEYRAVRLEEK